MTLCVLGKPGGQAHDAAEGWYACHECADRLLGKRGKRDSGVLADIELRCAMFTNPRELLPSAAAKSEGRRTVPGPRSPAVDALLAHTDLRTADIDGGQGILAVIESWARAIREDLSIDTEPARMLGTVPAGRTTITRELATIRHHWHWIMAQEWVDEFAREMRGLLAQLRLLAGERSKYIGVCPAITNAQPCGAHLRVPLDGRRCTRCCHEEIIACPNCGAIWHRRDWGRLALMIEDEEANMPAPPSLETQLLAAISELEEIAQRASKSIGTVILHTDDVPLSVYQHIVHNGPEAVLRLCAEHRELIEELRYYRAEPEASDRDKARADSVLRRIAAGYGIRGQQRREAS